MASVFTRILQRELPGHFVWEDQTCFAIMTIEPIRTGHLMVIPCREIDHWDALPEATLGHLMRVSQKIARAMKKALSCSRVGLSIIGLEVPHVHIHLLPLDSMQDCDFQNAAPASPQALAETAAGLRDALLAAGCREADI